MGAPANCDGSGDVLNHWGLSCEGDSGHSAVLSEMRGLRSVGDRSCGSWKVEASKGESACCRFAYWLLARLSGVDPNRSEMIAAPGMK